MKAYLKYSQNSAGTHILVLPTQTGIEFIDTCTIVRIEAISNYSKLFFKNGGTLVVAKVLRWFEDCLGPCHFIRIHRTHIVNKNVICGYTISEGAEVRLFNGERVAVSRRKRSQFLQSWKTAIHERA